MNRFAQHAALLTVASSLLVGQAAGQCATCPQPTVAFSPVTQTAFAPVTQTVLSPVAAAPVVAQPTVAYSPVAVQQPLVLQTVPPAPRRLFRGGLIDRLFGRRTVAAPVGVAPVAAPVLPGSPTFVTAAYQPTYPLTAAVAVPSVQTVARPVALSATAFRPVQLSPVTACSPICPTASCCPTGSCCPNTGVTAATYNAPVTGCPSCAAAGGVAPLPGAGVPPTPAPSIPPGSSVPDQRLRPIPGNNGGSPSDASHGNNNLDNLNNLDNGSASRGPADFGASAESYWEAPQLFSPSARTTQRPVRKSPQAPVWSAVYRGDGGRSAVRPTVYQVGPDAPARRAPSTVPGGWRSTRD